MTMADLLAKQDLTSLKVSRGQEIEGTVITIGESEIILDLGTKAEGVLQKKDLSPEQAANLKTGDKLVSIVIQSENESGQVLLGLHRISTGGGRNERSNQKWNKFNTALRNNQTLQGRATEVNKGGLIVEIDGIRGFLPSSQVALSQAANLDELVGKDVTVTVIEVDPNQNRLIFSQKTNVSEEVKTKLSKLKVGDTVEGTVASVLPFGIFVSLEDGVEGLVHISEIAWEKVEDPNTLYKVGDSVTAKVLSVDSNTGRANLSIKQTGADPFKELAENFQPDDVIKGTVTKISPMGVSLELKDGLEGFIPQNKLDTDETYEVGKEMTCLVDTVDAHKRRVNLVPFVTSTKDLIYK